MASDYQQGAQWWSAGSDLIYRRFARRLLACSPISLAGRLVLDLGAGSGAVSHALASLEARPVAVDASFAMLATARAGSELCAAVADAQQLPFGAGSFDAALSAFLINHLSEPHRLLSEAARVTSPGGAVMAMTFLAGDRHPAKEAVEAVAARAGWSAPPWYEDQVRWARLTDTPEGLLAEAVRAGLYAPEVRVLDVEAGPLSARELVLWRLGHAHMSGFVLGLSKSDREELMSEAEKRIGPGPHALRRDLLVVSSRVPT
jgi:SAM-dependent methyltransferase